jgi:hypothetical protein
MMEQTSQAANPAPDAGWIGLLTPRWFAKNLFEVTAKKLHELEMDGVILDMDNTLTEWRSAALAPTVVEWLGHLHDAGLKTCVVSNTHRPDRLKRICEPHGVDFVLGMKPRRGGFRQALKKMGTARERTALIGDQIFTDVFGGNRMGLYTILVPPLSPVEFIGTKINRWMERILFDYLKRTRRHPLAPLPPAPEGSTGEPANP